MYVCITLPSYQCNELQWPCTYAVAVLPDDLQSGSWSQARSGTGSCHSAEFHLSPAHCYPSSSTATYQSSSSPPLANCRGLNRRYDLLFLLSYLTAPPSLPPPPSPPPSPPPPPPPSPSPCTSTTAQGSSTISRTTDTRDKSCTFLLNKTLAEDSNTSFSLNLLNSLADIHTTTS